MNSNVLVAVEIKNTASPDVRQAVQVQHARRAHRVAPQARQGLGIKTVSRSHGPSRANVHLTKDDSDVDASLWIGSASFDLSDDEADQIARQLVPHGLRDERAPSPGQLVEDADKAEGQP